MLFADLCPADLQPLQTRPVNHRPGAQASRILEDTTGVFGVERLVVLLVNPYLFYRAHYLLGVTLCHLQGRAEYKRRGNIRIAIIEYQFRLGLFKYGPAVVHQRYLLNHRADVTEVSARVHLHRPAD